MKCLLLVLLMGCWGVGACADGLVRLVHYHSPVDASEQAYGVYIPAGPPPADGYPVVLHTHGYGWSVSTSFSQWQRDWADAHRWLLVQLNARGPNFYWGIGDVATWEVVDDLHERFGIDHRRVYITGSSMGGTGAFRQGVVHPHRIAAAVGVDGWADFREWHWHWYARKDQRHDIEEFRRPLLELGSPLYIAERARWGDIHVIADGRDTIVYPEQGIRLAETLMSLGVAKPGAYDAGLTFHPDKGHGGGYDVRWTYDYFLGKAARPDRHSFCIATTTLDHGELYWGRMERFHVQGLKALLDCTATECDPAAQDGRGVVDVITDNLDAFTLHLPLSPVADCARVSVYADGIPAYDGPPDQVTFEALRDTDDALVGWVETGASQAAGLRKSRETCGPIGHAFLSPFVVTYGSIGPADVQRRHREEAVAFCAGWNGFMVRAHALEAVAEDELDPAHIARRNLVVYGTLDTSRLLRRAHALHPLPVEVRGDRVIVRDALGGDREYRGRKFGAFVVYPNPLTEGRTYLVVASGRFATTPDGGNLRGLEYDLEKLAWAYPDYVVFNTDQRDLPHVMNVNNKPPVTCYEAGYFVEAGYFDADWRLDRYVTLDRARRARPEGVRSMRVAQVRVEETTQSLPVFEKVDGEPDDPPRERLPGPVLAALVRVVDEAGKPVRQARVTGRWAGVEADAMSRPTLSDGVAYFPYPGETWGRPPPRFVVLNVMATGAVYDFEADALAGGMWQSDDGYVALRPRPLRRAVDPEFPVVVAAQVANLSRDPLRIAAGFVPPNGEVSEATAPRTLDPGEVAEAAFRWHPRRDSPGGTRVGRFQATWAGAGGPATLTAPARFTFPSPRPRPLRVFEVAGEDIAVGEPYRVTARLYNDDPSRTLRVKAACSIVEAHRHLPVRELIVEPESMAEVAWEAAPDDEPLRKGEYHARVTVVGVPGVSNVGVFAVRQ